MGERVYACGCVCLCSHQPLEDSGWWLNILIFPHQKKKKERRKGKNEDADEHDDDEDHMLRLQKLSMQASDEEEESGGTLKLYSQFLLKSLVSVMNWMFFPQSPAPTKEARKRCGALSCLLRMLSCVTFVKRARLSGSRQVCSTQPEPERRGGGRRPARAKGVVARGDD